MSSPVFNATLTRQIVKFLENGIHERRVSRSPFASWHLKWKCKQNISALTCLTLNEIIEILSRVYKFKQMQTRRPRLVKRRDAEQIACTHMPDFILRTI